MITWIDLPVLRNVAPSEDDDPIYDSTSIPFLFRLQGIDYAAPEEITVNKKKRKVSVIGLTTGYEQIIDMDPDLLKQQLRKAGFEDVYLTARDQ